MNEPHQDIVDLNHSFIEVYNWLDKNGPVSLKTKKGTHFDVMVSLCQTGSHSGGKVIRFFQNKKEYGRSYECCWGHYYNCNKTRIGMYSTALDSAL